MGKGDPAVPILDDLLNDLNLVPPDWDGHNVDILAPSDTAGEAALTLVFYDANEKQHIVRLELLMDGTWRHRLVVEAEPR